MARWTLPVLLTAIERSFRAVFRSFQTFVGELRRSWSTKVPEASISGDLDEGELPESYARTRLVMLVVDPLLVHAYWEVLPNHLSEAKRRLDGDSNPAQTVLRFHETRAAGEVPEPNWFDVEVDLSARNWYTPLSSPNKGYYVDLGLKSGNGFVALARSNSIYTPRGWPEEEAKKQMTPTEDTWLTSSKNAADRHLEVAPPPPSRPEADGRRPSPAPIPAPVPQVPLAVHQTSSAETLEKKLKEFQILRELANQEARTIQGSEHWDMEAKEPVEPEQEEQVDTSSEERSEEALLDLTGIAERKLEMGIASTMLHPIQVETGSAQINKT
jgi:hypothetical protein